MLKGPCAYTEVPHPYSTLKEDLFKEPRKGTLIFQEQNPLILKLP